MAASTSRTPILPDAAGSEPSRLPVFNRVKFANAVLYILKNAKSRPGVTGLLRMLFFADYDHYRSFLKPITGAQYIALAMGPVVDDYKEHFASLVTAGIVERYEVPVYGRSVKEEYRPLCEPDLEVFTLSELQVLNDVVRMHGDASGSMLVERTHREGPWALVWRSGQAGSPIPYPLFRWLDNLPTEEDLDRARAQLSDPQLVDRIRELNQLAES